MNRSKLRTRGVVSIPPGEPGSINDSTKRTIEDPEFMAWEMFGKPQVALNVVSQLEQYAGIETAHEFAKMIISQYKKIKFS